MGNFFEMLGASFFLVLGLMSILWVIYYFKKNAGIVDIGWALGFVLSVWAYLFIGEGYRPKKWLITLMVTAWGIRLAWHLYQRFMLSGEDPRYQEIRKSWGTQNTDFKFFVMFIFQGVLVVLLSLPFIIIAGDSEPGFYAVELLGLLVWFVGLLGETYADQQLHYFKANPENKGKVCKEGLWRYSRHPNYFFEFIVWVGYYLFALGTSAGWIAIISPAIMLGLLLKVSGIPLTEAEAIKTKGSEYEDYIKTTSAFIPWFPSAK